ncbi:hypothetical protein [uncultured Parolsenella sp.]|uniref:hypothetical protein n=1 Tax=uncultured Parolsenella sp. TaxID=2083008 RepID=UPI0027D9350F|nr:hypothetical protein [uncultured Parolsenella sp.]
MLGLFALGSFAWLVCLALFVVAAPVIVACVAMREAVRHSRPAGPGPVEEAPVEEAPARVRPDGRARFGAFGWRYDLFDVEGRPGAILAVFEPYTDHSVGYLFEDHPSSDLNPLGVECAGVYPRPSREFPGEELWMHRPGMRKPSDNGGEWGPTIRVMTAMAYEISHSYGSKPEPKPLRGHGPRRR